MTEENWGPRTLIFFLAEFPDPKSNLDLLPLFHVFFSSPPCLALKTRKDDEEDDDEFEVLENSP